MTNAWPASDPPEDRRQGFKHSGLPVKAGPALRAAAALLLLGALAGCAVQAGGTVQPSAPGFWLGLVHGLIAPITLVISLFRHDVAMYAVPNAGGWYNFGFLLGLSAWAGGGSRAIR